MAMNCKTNSLHEKDAVKIWLISGIVSKSSLASDGVSVLCIASKANTVVPCISLNTFLH